MFNPKTGYLGNKNLKGKGANIEFTREMVDEYIKCSEDIIYFSEKYIKIVHVDHGLIPIVLFDFQKEIIEEITKNRKVSVNTSRQIGKTTTALCIILHYSIFNAYKSVALLANKGSSSRGILNRIKLAYEALPEWLQQGVVEWNKGSVEFENGSKILAGSTSSSSIRSESISFLYIDETAFVENWDSFFSSVYPTISSGQTTKILLTSTPNGLNHFHKTCMDAKSGANGYKYIEVPWYKAPGKDEAWKKETLDGMNNDLQKFAQEFCCEFIGSSGTLINGAKLKALVEVNPIAESSKIRIFEQPIKNRVYAAFADVARGKGLDYSALQIIDVTEMPYKQVAIFRDNLINPIDYSGVIHQMITRYNHAYVLVEINDIGGQVADLLFYEHEVETLLYTKNNGRAGKTISSGFGASSSIDRGIRTTKSVKAIGCNMIKMLIEQDQIILKDSFTIDELKTFSSKDNSFQAEKGKHDDLVMGLVLFGWLSDQTFFRDLTDINTMRHLREKNEEEMMDNILPLGCNSSDMLDDFETQRNQQGTW